MNATDNAALYAVTDDWGTVAYRDSYTGLLDDWGVERGGGLKPSQGRTTSPAKLDQLFRASESAEALAMLASYGAGVGLAAGDPDWSISCLPTWSRNPGRQRAATICVGRSEIAHVWLSQDAGKVLEWGFKIDLPDTSSVDTSRFEVSDS